MTLRTLQFDVEGQINQSPLNTNPTIPAPGDVIFGNRCKDPMFR